MDYEYTIDELIKTFTQHAEECEEQRKIQRKRHKEEYGNDLPYDDSFNICKAFLTFAKEIKRLGQNGTRNHPSGKD